MIRVDSHDGIALVTIARPPANAIDLGLAKAFGEVLGRIEDDPETRGLVLTGEGAFFSAGLDLKVVPTYGPEEQRAMVTAINRLITRLYGLGVPTVAAVNGHAIAGGMVIALACDHRIGGHGKYRLGLTETRVAVPYPLAAMTVVEAELAPAVARRVVLLARHETPERALADGILDELVPADGLVARAVEVAGEIAALPRGAYGRIKQQLRVRALDRMREVVAAEDDPLLQGWLSAETAPAAAEVLAARRDR